MASNLIIAKLNLTWEANILNMGSKYGTSVLGESVVRKKDLSDSRQVTYVHSNENILREYSNDKLANMVNKNEQAIKFRQEQKENRGFIEKYGERVLFTQDAFIYIALNFHWEEARVFFLLVGLSEYENRVKLSQAEIAEYLKVKHRSGVSRSLKSLCKRGFISIEKKNRENYYYINPKLSWKGQWKTLKEVIIDSAEIKNQAMDKK